MLQCKSLSFYSGPSGTAATARSRLLHDPQMRRNQPDHIMTAAEVVSPVTVTFAELPTRPAEFIDPFTLSPAEQMQRAMQLAKRFKQYYVADSSYLENRQMAVIVLKHKDMRRNEAAKKVFVDMEGNVSIYDAALPYPPAPQLVLHRVMLALGGVIAAVAMFTLFVLL